jgi:hypothetical protein
MSGALRDARASGGDDGVVISVPPPSGAPTAPGGTPSVASPLVDRVCENCAFPDDELVLVRRVYVTPETWDTPASHDVVEEPELWCVSCRSQYPHEDVDEDEEGEES